MINSYKERELKAGQKVKVYFNLHTQQFSVKDLASGLVVAHGDNILMEAVTFKVSEAGRQKVLREKRKNVHAYVIGTYLGTNENVTMPMRDAYYNPYKTESFQDSVTGKKLDRATIAYLSGKVVSYL